MTQEIVKKNSVIAQLAMKYGVTEETLLSTIKGTIMKADKNGREATNAELIAFLLVAQKYDLNPFTKEIYAFPDKRSGIIPIVGVDGFITLANRCPDFDGYKLTWSDDMVNNSEAKQCPSWCEVEIYRKDKAHPLIVREYLDEVYRAPFKSKEGYITNGPWQSHTKRMLRHKTLVQGFRVAFGLTGIYDEDEAERIIDAETYTPQISMKPEVKMPQSIESSAPEPIVQNNHISGVNSAIQEPSANLEAIEGLGKIAFAGKKPKFMGWLGSEFGVEKLSELTVDQVAKAAVKLNEIIKNAKK